MLTFSLEFGVVHIIENMSELPNIQGINDLYMDVETTSFTDDISAFHPYNGHRACGWAFTFDDNPAAYYLPVRHQGIKPNNLDIEKVSEFLNDLLGKAKRWINHNVKFDAHFAWVDGISFGDCELIDTVVDAKIHNSDRWNHKLKSLCRDWVGLDMEEELEVKAYLKSIKNSKGRKGSKNYARVPVDVLGHYAAMDVLGNRALFKWLEKRRDSELDEAVTLERKLTPILWDMENEGLKIDRGVIQLQKLQCLRGMVSSSDTVRDLTGTELIDSNAYLADMLLNRLELPVLGWTKPKGESKPKPSFDADTLLLYHSHPDVVMNEKNKQIVDAIITYRKEERFKSLYIDAFEEKADANDRIHPSYNQLVRTGRMSASDPNPQQMSERCKTMIIPEPGNFMWCSDASQMEFRVIAHYLQNPRILAAYRDDPNTDYHTIVADMIGVKRGPGKTLNFALAFGAGRKKITSTLMSNEDIVNEAIEQVNAHVVAGEITDAPIAVKAMAKGKAERAYRDYHEMIPELKEFSDHCSQVCKMRGYVKNAYGLRRHLPAKVSYRAFSTVVQGCAMMVIKERMVAVAPRYNSTMRDWGASMLFNVHDAVGGEVPTDDPKFISYVKELLEDVQKSFRVPFRWDFGISKISWADAKP